MRKYLLPLVLLLFFAVPAFAVGNLTVFSVPLSQPPVYANTNQSVNVLNLTLNVTAGSGADGVINITSINVTVTNSSEGNLSAGNISAVEIRNSTGFPIARNTSVNTANNMTFTISIPGGLTINTSNATIWIAINISRSATRFLNISVNITGPGEIGTNSTVNNITISGVSIKSNGVQIQNLHSNATISPRFVDTGVENQSFTYTLVPPTGTDAIRNINISFPANYTFSKLISIMVGGGVPDGATNNTAVNGINISLSTATTQTIQVNFTANTSTNPIQNRAFSSTIDGGNLSAVSADPTVEGVNVSTQPILNLTNVTITKSTAIINGTDYWEFNFTLNYTANISTGGLTQFRLTDWNTSSGSTLALNNSLCAGSRCASLRNETSMNTTGKFNITNDYESFIKGITVSSITQGSLITLVLRMVIPSNAPVSSNWQAAYGFLFRAAP